METDSSFKRSDIYARVTGEIVRAIEAGMEDYKMSSHQRAAGFLHAAAKKERAALSRNGFRIIPTVIEECQS